MPPNQAPVDMDYVKKAADEYNKIGGIAAKAGIQQGLHNEGFELAMVDGKRVYDVLFELLDPKLVKFQFQMSTITAGLVAADYFTKYPGRFISMHVQDVDMYGSQALKTSALECRRGAAVIGASPSSRRMLRGFQIFNTSTITPMQVKELAMSVSSGPQ